VVFASFYLLDNAQLWFHRMGINGSHSTWHQFVMLVNTRFRSVLTDSPIGELAMLRKSRTVYEYNKKFITLSCRDPTLTKPQQVQLFITGLGNPL
jgi:hypothetical protein